MTLENKPAEIIESGWKSLCLLGGIAPLIALIFFRRNMAAEYGGLHMLGFFPSAPGSLPADALGCFTVLHEHRLIGLTLLNIFDSVNYVLVALMFLGLYAALRRVSPGLMTLATGLALMGTSIYLASNQAFAMLALSGRYWSASTDAQRAMMLAAGEALLAIQNTAAMYGPSPFAAFLFINVAGLIAAFVMLRAGAFGKTAGYLGIASNSLNYGICISVWLAPPLAIITASLAAIFRVLWYIRISTTLLHLGRQSTKRGA
jgi:hypothetical protein